MLNKLGTLIVEGLIRPHIRRQGLQGEIAFDAFRVICRLGWRHSEVVMSRFGDRFELSLPDLVSNVIYLTGQWEPLLTRYVLSSLADGDSFVDVGANIGYYSLLASRLVGATGRVVAIEANREVYERLLRNVEMNRYHNIDCINAAAGSSAGDVVVYSPRSRNVGHSTTATSVGLGENMRVSGIVRGDTLDRLIDPALLRNARIIKVDVEGSELAVLSPLLPLLSAFDDRTEWLLEMTPQYCDGGQKDIDAIYAAFSHAGYTGVVIPNRYSTAFMVNPPVLSYHVLNAPPASQCDVVMTRHPDRLVSLR